MISSFEGLTLGSDQWSGVEKGDRRKERKNGRKKERKKEGRKKREGERKEEREVAVAQPVTVNPRFIHYFRPEGLPGYKTLYHTTQSQLFF